MSFLYEVLRDKPVALFMLDDSSPFQDYSGYNRTAALVAGSQIKSVALVSGAQYSTIFSSTTYASFVSPVFTQENENREFTLEAWVTQASLSTSEQQIIGHDAQMDGLILNGTLVSFVVKYGNGAPDAVVSYDIQGIKSIHVVGVYTTNKISLFVNGKLVDDLSLTQEQHDDFFLLTSIPSNLHSGETSGSQQIAVNGICIYSKALSGADILRHYKVGMRMPTADDVVSSYAGTRFALDVEKTDTFVDATWGEDIDWTDGLITNLTVDEGKLLPQFSNGVSLAGQWITSVPLDGAAGSTIYSAVLDWEGTGAVVQTSTNGTTWETVVRGTRPANTAGLASTNTLQIRVTFPGGVTDDESYIKSLRFIGIDDSSWPVRNGRTLILAGGTPGFDYLPNELNAKWGTNLPSGSSTITLSANANSPAEPIRTIEYWVRRVGGNPALSATGMTTGTYYENGVAGDGVVTSGRWTLVHFVSDVDLTGTISLTGAAQVGHIAVYEEALTATQISDINLVYSNANPLNTYDATSDKLVIPESGSTHKVYAHDWTILAAG